MRLIIHFARFGPYHLARLRAAADELGPLGWEVIGLQTASLDATYDWRESVPSPEAGGGGAEILTIFPGRVYEEIPPGECRRKLVSCLNDLAPNALAVPGWGTLDARVSLGWCRRRGAKAVIMSETREADGTRRWWRERIKAILMRHAYGALVGGAAHRDYLLKLGIPASRIETGYNVVDNAYFAEEAARWRSLGGASLGGASLGGEREAVGGEQEAVGGEQEAVGGCDAGKLFDTAPFFLASNRFIPRKNLERLIEAYALYCQAPTADSPPPTVWPLCLLGDGPLRSQLISQCHALGLTVIESAPREPETSNLKPETHHASSTANCSLPSVPPPHTGIVFFPGFRQIEELPRFYASAGAFIHPALEEPWGLVINEAMACGLPVLAGNNVGAAAELVREGHNGWTFNAASVEEIAGAMRRLASLPEAERSEMGRAGAAYLEEHCPTRAFGEGVRRVIE